MGRIAGLFIFVCVMVVPKLCLVQMTGISAVYNADTTQYVIYCGSLNLTAVPSGIDTYVTEL